MQKASDVMTKSVVTLPLESSIYEAWKVLSEHQISGAPVISSDDQKVVGVVSLADLARQIYADRFDPLRASSFYINPPYPANNGDELLAEFEDNRHFQVAECMNPIVLAVAPNDSVASVAKLMHRNHVHRVLVIENGKLLGVVTTFDLMLLLE